MKKYIDPIPDGGAPLHNNRITTQFQNDLWSAIEGMMSEFSNNPTGNYGIIVSGGEVVDNAGNFDIAAGVVYLNGKFLRLAAATNQTFTKYIAAKTVSYEAKTFADGGSKNLIVVEEAELVGSAPGSGQYITISSLTSANIRNIKARGNGVIYRNSAGVESFRSTIKKILESGDWNMDATGTKLVAHGLSDVSKIISIKATIYNDAADATYDIYQSTTGADVNAWISGVGATNVSLERLTGGFFDSTDFNATSYNRCKIVIELEE